MNQKCAFCEKPRDPDGVYAVSKDGGKILCESCVAQASKAMLAHAVADAILKVKP